MRSIRVLLAIACIVFFVAGLSHAGPAAGNIPQEGTVAADVYKKDLPSIVYIDLTTTDGVEYTGTGFLAIKDGVVVTAWHVINGAKSATARFPDGKVYEIVGVIDHDPDDDAVLLKINEKGRPLLALQANTPIAGSQAFVIGAPLGSVIIADGTLDQMPKYRQTRDRYQTTCEVIEGDSGSPLVDENGQVIGIVTGGKATPSGHIARAIPIKYILNMNANLPAAPLKDITANPAPTNKSP